MKLTLTFFLMLSSHFALSSNKIVGGSDLSPSSIYTKTVVSLLTEYKGTLRQYCTGTLIGARVIITAAHCIDGIVNDKVFVAMGENALASKDRVKVSHLIYYKPQFWNTISDLEDIALLVIEHEFKNYEISTIGNYLNLNNYIKVTQVGYGLQSFEPSGQDYEYPNFGKLKILNGVSEIESIEKQKIGTKSSPDKGVMGGDSGGPLFLHQDKSHQIYGVLSQGGPSWGDDNYQTGLYTSPYYFIDWINSVLPKDLNISVDYTPINQFPESSIAIIKIEDFPKYNRENCQNYRSGWDITKDQVCWPSTQESCLYFEQSEVPGEVYWNNITKSCDVIE